MSPMFEFEVVFDQTVQRVQHYNSLYSLIYYYETSPRFPT